MLCLLSDVEGLSQTDILLHEAGDRLSADEQRRLLAMADRIAAGEPYQYVVGFARFCGLRIAVAPGVLIPRPETEELVEWAVSDLRAMQFPSGHTPTAVDFGTGSGCIALALKHALPNVRVEGLDISPEALKIAHFNGKNLQIDVQFRQADMLHLPGDFFAENSLDAVVSNPPYVLESERSDMESVVLDHEPALALFVPDADPLRHFSAISSGILPFLRPGGRVYFETNRRFAADVAQLLTDLGYADAEVRADQFGNPRMVAATKP